MFYPALFFVCLYRAQFGSACLSRIWVHSIAHAYHAVNVSPYGTMGSQPRSSNCNTSCLLLAAPLSRYGQVSSLGRALAVTRNQAQKLDAATKRSQDLR